MFLLSQDLYMSGYEIEGVASLFTVLYKNARAFVNKSLYKISIEQPRGVTVFTQSVDPYDVSVMIDKIITNVRNDRVGGDTNLSSMYPYQWFLKKIDMDYIVIQRNEKPGV
jgi:hypothetical protein